MHKLPALPAIKHALKAVINFRQAGIRIGLPWILVLTGVSLLERYFFEPADTAGSGSPGEVIYRPSELIIALLSIVAFSSIAVNWHRYILLDEVTAPENILRLDRPVWIYASRTLMIMLMALTPVLVLSAIVFRTLPGAGSLLAVPLFAAGVFIMRMSVALPAAALKRNDFGIGAALQATQANNWQFAGLVLLNGAILMATFLALFIVLTIAGSVNATVGRTLGIALSVPVNLFLTLFSISLLSSLYGFFVEKRSF